MPNIANVMIFVAVASFSLAACQRDRSEPLAGLMTAPASKLEGRLDIVAPANYIESGRNHRDFDWVSGFEQATACKVGVTVAHGPEETVRLINEGGYDAVIASGEVSLRLIASGKVRPIEIDRVHSYPKIDPRLRNAAWHTVDGVHYGVPYQWRPNVLLYNTEALKTAPTDWSLLFEEQALSDGKSNKGRIQAFGSPLHIADAALYLMASRPELGIDDPYELDETQYAAVLDALRRQKTLLRGYWRDTAALKAEFSKKSGAIVASIASVAQANALRMAEASLPVAWIIPAAGATGRADTTLMPADAKHPNCAYAWMEWSITPAVQAETAAWLSTVPVVPAACAHWPLDEEMCRAHGAGTFADIRFGRLPQAKCAEPAGCVPYSRWTQDYLSLMDD